MDIKLLFCVFFQIYLFHLIICQQNNYMRYEYLTFDEAVNEINKNAQYSKTDYDNIISNLTKYFENRYIYLDIAKSPPPPYKPVDIIKELKSIKTEKITFYEFFQELTKSILKLKDGHIQILYKEISKLSYIAPIQYYIESNDNVNYLFVKRHEYNSKFFNDDDLKKLDDNIKYPIKSINNKDPFDYIQTFGGYDLFKSEHAIFSINLNRLSNRGRLDIYPFNKETLTNITIKYMNNEIFNFDYKILKINDMSEEFSKFFNSFMSNHNPNNILYPTIFDIENEFIKSKNNYRILQNDIWDYKYKGKLKYKIDNENQVNVIYQNTFSFNFLLERDANEFHQLIGNKILENNYPIILIEDLNGGGYLNYVFEMLNVINPFLMLNTFNHATKLQNQDRGGENKTEIDLYNNSIKHNRTKIVKSTYSKKINNIIIGRKQIKPNEIIVFTDGFSYSATSVLIKNLQESGNAIIVGYNGNPSEKKKNEKFDSSQSPSAVRNFNDEIEKNLNKYGITIYGITFLETFNDSYINKNITPIPREYIINPIDERSNIYGFYNDDRYLEFINEAKRIFKKYESECNNDNKNMVFLNDSCKFNDKNKIGGNKCINGKWSKNECQVSNCKFEYTFDTFKKECEGKNMTQQELENNKFINGIVEELEQKSNQIGNKTKKITNNTNFGKYKIIIVIFIITVSVLLIIAFILIFVYFHKNKNNNEGESMLEASLIKISDKH